MDKNNNSFRSPFLGPSSLLFAAVAMDSGSSASGGDRKGFQKSLKGIVAGEW